MTTLALDLGQNIGWLKGSTVGPIQHGTIQLEGGSDLGLWLNSAAMVLPKLMRGCDDLAVEQPFLQTGGKDKEGKSKPGGYFPARKLLGLLGLVHWIARMEGIPSALVHEIPVASGKLALSGHGNADAEMMIAAACDWYGFEPHEIDEHQAHAGGLLKFHLYGPGLPKRTKPRSGPGRSILRGEST